MRAREITITREEAVKLAIINAIKFKLRFAKGTEISIDGRLLKQMYLEVIGHGDACDAPTKVLLTDLMRKITQMLGGREWARARKKGRAFLLPTQKLKNTDIEKLVNEAWNEF